MDATNCAYAPATVQQLIAEDEGLLESLTQRVAVLESHISTAYGSLKPSARCLVEISNLKALQRQIIEVRKRIADARYRLAFDAQLGI